MFANFTESLQVTPPSSLLSRYEPLVKNRLDAELEFTVMAGKTHIIPLDVPVWLLIGIAIYLQYGYVKNRKIEMNRISIKEDEKELITK